MENEEKSPWIFIYAFPVGSFDSMDFSILSRPCSCFSQPSGIRYILPFLSVYRQHQSILFSIDSTTRWLRTASSIESKHNKPTFPTILLFSTIFPFPVKIVFFSFFSPFFFSHPQTPIGDFAVAKNRTHALR